MSNLIIQSPLKNLNELKDEIIHTKDRITTPYMLVMDLIKVDEQLEKSYWIMQDVREMLANNDCEEFKKIIDDKRALPRGIRKSLKTYGKYIRYIKNTMEYPSLNNGYLEGINNKLKLIKRVSFGYRKFDNFRGRVLIIPSLTKKDKKKSIVRVPIKSCRKIA